MTDVVTLDPPPPGRGTLRQLRRRRCTGRSAPPAARPVKPLDPPVRHFIGEFAQEFFDVDSRVLRSLRRLFFSPGFLTREHVDGRRVPGSRRSSCICSTSVAVFAVLAVVGDERRRAAHGDRRSERRQRRPRRTGTAAWTTCERRSTPRGRLDAARDVRAGAVLRLAGRARRGAGPGGTIRRTSSSRCTSMPPRSASGRHRQPRRGRGRRPGSRASTIVTVIYVVGYTFLALRTAYGDHPRSGGARHAVVGAGLLVGADGRGRRPSSSAAVFGRYWLEAARLLRPGWRRGGGPVYS